MERSSTGYIKRGHLDNHHLSETCPMGDFLSLKCGERVIPTAPCRHSCDFHLAPDWLSISPPPAVFTAEPLFQTPRANTLAGLA